MTPTDIVEKFCQNFGVIEILYQGGQGAHHRVGVSNEPFVCRQIRQWDISKSSKYFLVFWESGKEAEMIF